MLEEAPEVLRGLAAEARLAARRTAHASTDAGLPDADADALLMDARVLARIASRIEILAEDVSMSEHADSGLPRAGRSARGCDGAQRLPYGMGIGAPIRMQ